MKKSAFLILLSVITTFSTSAFSETVYIKDQLTLSLRDQPVDAFTRVEWLSSGAKLELLETQDDYSKVRTEGGAIGWIKSGYIVLEPVAADQLKLVSAELKQLQVRYKELNDKFNNRADNNADSKTLAAENQKLTEELNRIREVSAEALSLDANYNDISVKYQEIKNELEIANKQVDRLKSESQNETLIYGGGLVIVGIIVGFILISVRPKGKNNGWA